MTALANLPSAAPAQPFPGMTASYAAALASLSPVTLEELTCRAERLTRVDRKYLVPRRELAELVLSLGGRAQVLEIDGRREFGYRSVYLDTEELTCFHAAGRSRRRRFKVRTRTYVDSGLAFLEVKTTGPRGTTVKQRIPLTGTEEAPLDRAGAGFVGSRLREAGVGDADVDRLSARLVTAYRRSTLLLQGTPGAAGDEGDRLTIDTDLAWTSLGQRPRDLDRPSLAVVETKAGSTPTEVDRLLWARGRRPVRMSKYGTGMAAISPDLPRMKWHRTLARDLTPTPSAAPARTPKDPS